MIDIQPYWGKPDQLTPPQPKVTPFPVGRFGDDDCPAALGIRIPLPKPTLPSAAKAASPFPKKLVEQVVPGSQKITLLPAGQHAFESVPMEALVQGDLFSLPGEPGVFTVKLRVAHFVATDNNRVLDTRQHPQVLREKRKAVTLIDALEQAITGTMTRHDEYALHLFPTPEESTASHRKVIQAIGTDLTADEANTILDQNLYGRILRESALEQEKPSCLVLIS